MSAAPAPPAPVKQRARRRCWTLTVVGMALATQVTSKVSLFVISPPEKADLERRKALIAAVISGSVAPVPAWAGDVFAKRSTLTSDPSLKVIDKVDEYGRVLVEVARPTGLKKKLYSFDLPLVKGNIWGDYSNYEEKELGVIFKGKFGNETENEVLQTTVLAGVADPEYVKTIREKNYTEGYGILRDEETPGQIDIEWTDFERRRRTYYKVHNFLRVLRNLKSTKKDKDVLLVFTTPEPQLEKLQSLWPTMRDSLKLGR